MEKCEGELSMCAFFYFDYGNCKITMRNSTEQKRRLRISSKKKSGHRGEKWKSQRRGRTFTTSS